MVVSQRCPNDGEVVFDDEVEGEGVVVEGLQKEIFGAGQHVLWRDRNVKYKDRFQLKSGVMQEHRGRGAYVVRFSKKDKLVNRALLVAYENPTESNANEEQTVMIDTIAQADDESDLTSPDIPSRFPFVCVGFRALRNRFLAICCCSLFRACYP
jgi:hypothetical protein